MGKANVYVDGKLMQAGVDAYSPTEQTQVPLFTSAVLRAAIHTLAIEVRGDKHPLSSGVYIIVDGFYVTPWRTGAVRARLSIDEPPYAPIRKAPALKVPFPYFVIPANPNR